MRKPTAYRSRTLKFAITPMIDIVFLLVIFFLVSTHYVKSEVDQPIILPEASQAIKDQDSVPRRMTITVTLDGDYFWGSRESEWQEIERILLQELEGDGTSDLQVRIRGDARVPYEKIRPIVKTCAKAGISNCAFAVIPTQDK